jgi:hypothetical protein
LLSLNIYTVFAQKNIYKLSSQINVSNISLERSTGNAYTKNKTDRKLVELNFLRENDSVSFVTKIYNTDSEESKIHKVPSKIKTLIFDSIVDKLNNLNIEKIEYDFNIADGISYNLFFCNSKYSINLSIHTTGIDDENTEYKEFLRTFNYVWKQFEE